VCSSLAEAHRKGIVHRDVKPENIMLVPVDGGGEMAKVLDFGLAKLREVEGAEDVTCRGVILGTPSYMAPEQIEGHEVDARTDVYSVGALMYRLATGHPPFRAGSPLALLEKHLHEKPIPPADRCPELCIPLGLSRLVMRALRKDPSDRFQRIEDLQALLVEELRAAGSSSVETLLDPSRLRRIARADARTSDAGPIATRDEVDAYERRLRRRRYGAAGALGALALAAAGAGASLLFAREARDVTAEQEPNDTPAEANAIALGKPVTGRLGKRIDATHGDRDFYAFELPAEAAGEKSFLRLRVSALPNMATCTMLYRRGFADAVGQYCAGRPGRELVIPAIALDPGSYLVAVLQDMDPYGGPPPYVQESISDSYTLLAESTIPDPEAEIEPNDRLASATPLVLGRACAARIGWARDQDFFCLREPTSSPAPARVRWRVRAGLRDGGALEATPMRGEEAGAPVRIHLDETGRRSDSDVTSPWQSAPVAAGGAPRCLRVRLDLDAGGSGPGSGVPYVVEAESVP
jgi:serine/threonine-protein kinase